MTREALGDPKCDTNLGEGGTPEEVGEDGTSDRGVYRSSCCHGSDGIQWLGKNQLY